MVSLSLSTSSPAPGLSSGSHFISIWRTNEPKQAFPMTMVYPRMLNLHILDEDLTNLRARQQNKKELLILSLQRAEHYVLFFVQYLGKVVCIFSYFFGFVFHIKTMSSAALKAVWPLLLALSCDGWEMGAGLSSLAQSPPFRLSTSTP